MLALESAAGRASRLPLLVRIGLAVLVFGTAADLVAHTLATGPGPDGGHAAAELTGHLVAFAGMTLILLGVVVDGVRQARTRRAAARRNPEGVA